LNNLQVNSPAYNEDITDRNFEPTILQYLPYAFLGFRGSMRKRMHIRLHSSNVMWPLEKVCVSMANVGTYSDDSAGWIDLPARCIQRGSVSFVPVTNGGIEYELPFYSNNLFAFSFCDNLVGSSNSINDMITTWTQKHIVHAELDNSSGDGDSYVIVESAIGDDFTFFRYCGAPMYSWTGT